MTVSSPAQPSMRTSLRRISTSRSPTWFAADVWAFFQDLRSR
jgi:hypothetical protein